jgi:hypothetical protein
MHKQLLIPLILLLSCSAFAQKDSSRYVHRHLIRSMATISPGFMTSLGTNNIYLHGNLEYYVNESISVRGDSYYFISAIESVEHFKMHHTNFTGASYHFRTNGHFDPYLGIQPGFSISQAIYNPCPEEAMCLVPAIVQQKPSVNPLISGVLGFNYYAQKWFHLFGEARYVQGKHLSEQGPLNLNEIRFSFGLGINIL